MGLYTQEVRVNFDSSICASLRSDTVVGPGDPTHSLRFINPNKSEFFFLFIFNFIFQCLPGVQCHCVFWTVSQTFQWHIKNSCQFPSSNTNKRVRSDLIFQHSLNVSAFNFSSPPNAWIYIQRYTSTDSTCVFAANQIVILIN